MTSTAEQVSSPPLSRRSSGRPHTLRLPHSSGEWTPDLILDDLHGLSSGATMPDADPIQNSVAHHDTPFNLESHANAPVQQNRVPKQPKSPCFVHSLLDKGASFQDWLQQSSVSRSFGALGHDISGNHLEPPKFPMPQPSSESPPSSMSSVDEDEETETDEFEGVGSLTMQLAETAVGVREMSKQLGRTRVKANIQSVMIITKARDNRLIKLTRELALYLMLTPRGGSQRGSIVYVDAQLRTSRRFDAEGIERDHPELFIPSPKRRSSSHNSLASLPSEAKATLREQSKDDIKRNGQLRYWTSDMCSRSPQLFDFVVTLGGDGTVLFTSWLFQRIVPPVLPFALGSLGFLTNFDFADHQAVMDSAIDSGIRVNLRMRFTCTVYRAVAPEHGKGRKAVKKGETGEIMMKNIGKDGWEALEGGWAGSSGNSSNLPPICSRDKEIMCFTTRPVESFEVLNELVVDRGPSPYVSLLELFGDEHHMTTVQADGLTVSTPTGSTAYSLSAGGSLVHPEIPALLITPICPHTLSFRPMLLPDSMELRICVPYNSRSTAWASFDGRGRVELKQGDHIKVTASKYPFPTVCADKQSTDWFHSISRTLKWNERQRQKSFVVVEEGPEKSKKKKAKKEPAFFNLTESTPMSGRDDPNEDIKEEDEEGEEDEEDDEEEKFDIDDKNIVNPEAESLAETQARMKAREEQQDARIAAVAIMRNNSSLANVSQSSSGINSPSRYAGPIPHPRPISPRHVSFDGSTALTPRSSSENHDERRMEGENGDRDDIHSPRTAKESSKSKIPRNRDMETDNVRTPRAYDHSHPTHSTRHRSLSVDCGTRHAFAVWGHDESDSNTSDSDSQA
ncbi:NAD+ kinase [Hysterangium stoloniferum]|nr:NAD+ kinase [Hysterangium stoloniferum]